MAMVNGYEGKEVHRLKRCFESFKDLGSTSTIHNSLFIVVFAEE
jgi:hypothetical protein